MCYYGFGMPLALYLAFFMELGVGGLWIGFTIASIALDIGFFFIIHCSDWEKAASEARSRIENNTEQGQLLISSMELIAI